MTEIQFFLAKYHAVPANDDGPVWERATDDALCGWAAEDKETWKSNPGARRDIEPRMVRVYRELDRRREAAEIGSDRRSLLALACGRIAGCIGGVRLYDLIAEMTR